MKVTLLHLRLTQEKKKKKNSFWCDKIFFSSSRFIRGDMMKQDDNRCCGVSARLVSTLLPGKIGKLFFLNKRLDTERTHNRGGGGIFS